MIPVAGWKPWRLVLPYVDYFVPSLLEGRALTGLDDPAEVARALLAYGVKTVGLKMEWMGAWRCLLKASGALPAFQVDVMDATGAGDAFAAGFIAGVWARVGACEDRTLRQRGRCAERDRAGCFRWRTLAF